MPTRIRARIPRKLPSLARYVPRGKFVKALHLAFVYTHALAFHFGILEENGPHSVKTRAGRKVAEERAYASM